MTKIVEVSAKDLQEFKKELHTDLTEYLTNPNSHRLQRFKSSLNMYMDSFIDHHSQPKGKRK